MSIINKKVYQHLDEIISLYNNLYHDQDNEELKQKLIHRIKKFDWNRFKNSIDYISHNRELILKEIKDLEHHRELILEKIKDLEHHRELILEKIKDLQQLQTWRFNI